MMRSRVWQTWCMPRPNGFDYIDFSVVPLLHSASIVSPSSSKAHPCAPVLGASPCARGFMCGYLGSDNLDCNVDVGFLQHNIFDGTFTHAWLPQHRLKGLPPCVSTPAAGMLENIRISLDMID
jgi:hypothetical protein